MQSLYQLCLNKIVDINMSIKTMPDHIQNDLKIVEIRKTCGNVVSKIINIEKNRNIYLYCGYIEGIQHILEKKKKIYNNLILFESCSGILHDIDKFIYNEYRYKILLNGCDIYCNYK